MKNLAKVHVCILTSIYIGQDESLLNSKLSKGYLYSQQCPSLEIKQDPFTLCVLLRATSDTLDFHMLGFLLV